jgi:hypothetical protein
LYSRRQAFLTNQNKNGPNCFKIGRVIQIFVSTSNFEANKLVLKILEDCKMKIGVHLQKYSLDSFSFFRGAKSPSKIILIFARKAITYKVRNSPEKNSHF